MTKLNVAFVRCGGIAAHYLAVYRDLDFVRVVCAIDVNPENAQRAAALNAESTSDYAAALADGIDAVIINTPNSQHAPQAIAAIEAGKHVLLQKPVAASLEDAEAIGCAAARSRRTVGLYMSYFDRPLVHDLRDMAAQGRLGGIVHCYARLMHRGGMMWSNEALQGKPTWRGSLAETGGGCFIQLAVHYVHIFEWVTGARVVGAAGFTRNLHCPGLEGEDLACAVLQLDSGALITLDTARIAALRDWPISGHSLAKITQASIQQPVSAVNSRRRPGFLGLSRNDGVRGTRNFEWTFGLGCSRGRHRLGAYLSSFRGLLRRR